MPGDQPGTVDPFALTPWPGQLGACNRSFDEVASITFSRVAVKEYNINQDLSLTSPKMEKKGFFRVKVIFSTS